MNYYLFILQTIIFLNINNKDSFEYYMFHFVLFGLKLTSNDILDFNNHSNEQSVYRLLFINYIKYFLPLDNAASLILPQLQLKVLSTFSNQKQFTSPSWVSSNKITQHSILFDLSVIIVENCTYFIRFCMFYKLIQIMF